jgi:hypothetical protein
MEYCAAHSDEDTTGQQISEERGKELSDGYERAYRVLRKATSVGAYIISDEVAEALAKLDKRPRLNPEDCAWFEIFDADYQAYKTTFAEVRALAKKDLKV